MKQGQSKIHIFIVNILLTIDQAINVLMLGDPDETVSSRAGRVFPNSDWAKFIDIITSEAGEL